MNYLELLVKLVFLLGGFFVMSLQPVLMVSGLILISLFYSYIIYNEIGTYWLSYVLLMVMLSGVLVVFTYMVTLIPNESFEIYNLVIFLSFMMMMMMLYKYNYMFDMSFITVNLWITYLGVFSLFLVSFLFGIMLLVIKLSYMTVGSFRI